MKNQILNATKSLNKGVYRRFEEFLQEIDEFEGLQLLGFTDRALYGVLEGPAKTIYENGFFPFELKFPEDFPFKPPRFRFMTKMFHPNFYKDGHICLDILNFWSVGTPIFLIIFDVLNILIFPDPQGVNYEAMDLYRANVKEFENKAKDFTLKYANFDNVQNELKKLNFEIEIDD